MKNIFISMIFQNNGKYYISTMNKSSKEIWPKIMSNVLERKNIFFAIIFPISNRPFFCLKSMNDFVAIVNTHACKINHLLDRNGILSFLAKIELSVTFHGFYDLWIFHEALIYAFNYQMFLKPMTILLWLIKLYFT